MSLDVVVWCSTTGEELHENGQRGAPITSLNRFFNYKHQHGSVVGHQVLNADPSSHR